MRETGPTRGLAALLTLIVAWSLATAPPRASIADDKPAKKSVRLTIDYGDGVRKQFTSLPWRAKMTVLDMLTAAKNHPRGIEFRHRGKGATAFVTQIDDLKNEGRGRNWLFRLNGKLGKRSCGQVEVKSGDKVTWSFAKYKP